MSPKKDTQKSAKSTTAINKKFKGFTDEERAAMKERAQELKAAARRGPRGQGGRGKRRAREDRRDAGTGSRHGHAAPCYHQSQRASPLAEDSGTGCPRMPRTARSSASSKARRSSKRGTRRSASATRRTSTKAPCGRSPSR